MGLMILMITVQSKYVCSSYYPITKFLKVGPNLRIADNSYNAFHYSLHSQISTS